MRFEMAQIFLPDFVYQRVSSFFTGSVFKFHKQGHPINNKERGLLLLVSGQCGASQSAALFALAPCAKYSTFMVAIRFVQHWIVPFSHPFSPLDISVWQVPGSIIVGPHGWKAWVFHRAGRDDRKQVSANLFGKRFENQNFRNICCKISCLPACLSQDFRTSKKWYNCLFLTYFYPKKVTWNFGSLFSG